MSYVAIPTEVFESQKYQGLTFGTREFLLRLYHQFGDCNTFVLDRKKPEEYGETNGAAMMFKVRDLIEQEFLKVCGEQVQDERGPRPRVLTFTHSAVPFYEAA